MSQITSKVTYDLHQLDKDGRWQRIYSRLDLPTAKANLSLELSDATEKGRWKAVRVETQTQEFDVDLSTFGVEPTPNKILLSNLTSALGLAIESQLGTCNSAFRAGLIGNLKALLDGKSLEVVNDDVQDQKR